MISKCKNWLKSHWQLKETLKAERSRSQHYAMLFQNQLEENIEIAARNRDLRRKIQEFEMAKNGIVQLKDYLVPEAL